MSSTKKSVLCVGDVALDVIVKLEIDGGRESFATLRYGSDTPSHVITRGGGTGANVAAWLTTSETQVELVARIGADSVGEALVRELEEQGVRCHRRVIADLSTGTVVVLVDRSGERTMFPDSGANAGLNPQDLPDLDALAACYISGYALFNKKSHSGVLRIFELLRKASIPIFFDPASVGTMSTFADHDTIMATLPLSDVMILNESEARFLAGLESDSDSRKMTTEEMLKALTRFASVVVIKRNEMGAVALDGRDGRFFEDRQPRRNPVDTTGAGDSFAAGFIAEWVKERDIAAALRSGNQMAGQCVEVIGARPLKSR